MKRLSLPIRKGLCVVITLMLSTGTNVAYFDAGKRWFRIRFANPGDERLTIFVVDGTDADATRDHGKT